MKTLKTTFISLLTTLCLMACVVDEYDSVVTDVEVSASETSLAASGATTTLTATVSTVGSPSLTYSWSISEGEDYATLSSKSGESVTLTSNNASTSEQTVKVKCKVKDGTNTSSDSVSITVAAASEVSVSLNSPSSISYNESATLTASATTTGSGEISYAWEITKGSSYASLSATTGESVTFTANNTTSSAHDVVVQVTASDGTSSETETATISVSEHGVTIATEITGVSISADATTISATGSTSLRATPTYTGTPTITYAWSITEGSEYAELSSTSESSVTLTGTNTDTSAQTVTISLTVTDDSGNEVTATKEITVSAASSSATDTTTADLYLDLTESKVSADNATWKTISTSKTKFASETLIVKFTEDDSDESTGLIKIDATSFTSELTVSITGTMTTGGIKIQSNGSDAVNVILNGATIASSNYPCLEVTKGSATNVTLVGTNTFTDGRSYGTGYGEEYSTTSGATYYDDDRETYVSCTVVKTAVSEGSDSKGTLFSKGNLTISGSGSLSVTQAYKNCIASKEGVLTIEGGTLSLKNYTSSSETGKNALFGGLGIVVNDGTITFDGKGIISKSDVRKANGFKTNDSDDGTSYASAYVKINGGTTSITTYNGKGISTPYVYITGGTNTFTITGTTTYSENSTTGTYYDADGVKQSNQSISFSPEGIEGDKGITISGGTTVVSAPDDGINVSTTGGTLSISGGFLYVKAQGDGLDSNGNITISGGITVVSQTGNGNSPIDCGDNYKFTVTGTSATVFAMGGSGMFSESIPSSTVSPMIYSPSLGSSSSSLAVNGIIGLSSPQSYAAAILISSSLTSGTSYKFVKGGTLSGTLYNSTAGVYFPATVSGGSSVSATATTSSSSGNTGGPGGTTRR